MQTLPTTMSKEAYQKVYRTLRDEALKFFRIPKSTFDYRVRQQMPEKYSWVEYDGENYNGLAGYDSVPSDNYFKLVHVTDFSKALPFEWVQAAIAVLHNAESESWR